MKQKKRALIFGVSGQDGAYLANLLIKKNYSVIGITRNLNEKNLFRLKKLNILNKVIIKKGSAVNANFVHKTIKKNQNVKEIYYLAGDASVTNSFLHPNISFKSNVLGILNILISTKNINKDIKIFNAASAQFFGNHKNNFYNENSLILPQSPYGISKASAFWFTKFFREVHGLYACSGILFNHESPLRSKEFVTKKIIDISKKIKRTNKGHLYLGNIDIWRDWGWAPEYVNAMWLMMQQKTPIDLVIGSGKKNSIREFVYEAFKILNIKKNRLRSNTKKFKRKIDIKSYKANTSLAKKTIKWSTKISFKQIVYKMIKNELF